MAETAADLAATIAQYNKIHGTNISPTSPWTTPGWDGGNNSLHAQIETLKANGPTATDRTALNGFGAGGGTSFFGTPSQIAGLGPQPYSSFGATPQVNPTLMGSSNYTAATMNDPARYQTQTMQADPGYQAAQAQSAGTFNPATADASAINSGLAQSQSLNRQSMIPQFADDRRNLDESLAGRGIFNSGAAAQASNDLSQRQDATMAGMNAPLISQYAGYTQQDALANQGAQNQALMFGVENQQATNFANQGATNQAAGQAAGFRQDTAGYNAQAENANRAQYQAYQEQNGLANQNAQNQAGQFNASADQSAAGYNATAANDASIYNANAYGSEIAQNRNDYNNYLAQLFGQGSSVGGTQLGSYLGSFGANPQAIGILGQGLANAGNAYAGAYGNAGNLGPSLGTAFGNLAGSFGKKTGPVSSTPAPSSFGDGTTPYAGAGIV